MKIGFKFLLIVLLVQGSNPELLNAATDSLVCRQAYMSAKNELELMLQGTKPLSYERAIFLVENAWNDNRFHYDSFQEALHNHTELIKRIGASNTDSSKLHPQRDLLETAPQKTVQYQKAVTNYAIFNYLTTTGVVDYLGQNYAHFPYTYSSQDPFGTSDWKNTQVINLINTGKGNCFALASLFKIFSDRLKSDAVLCTAPSHIYIRHADSKGTLYNIEVSSRSFPGTGTLETLTYTTDAATKNKVALRDLDDRQAVALCLIYLAKGYESKLGKDDNGFMMQCAESALRYDGLNLNALLLKAELLQAPIIAKHQPPTQLQNDSDFKRYEALIERLFSLGYREMPLEMKNILIKGWNKDSLSVVITQNHLPKTFQKFGEKDERHASLSWGLFDEVMATKAVERYGNTLFDTKSKKIIGFAVPQPIYNDYNFDPVVFAWNIDPLAHKAPWSSPYAFCEGNPILYLDPDGRFRSDYNDEMLKANGLTKTQMVRFEAIMNNMSKLLENNPQLMNVISSTTGRTPDQIRTDYSPGNGPGVTINDDPFKASAWGGQIHIDPAVIKHLAAIDPSNTAYLAEQVTGVAMTLAHEHGHWGDQQSNGGSNTGQFATVRTNYKGGGSMTKNNFYTKPSDFTGTPNTPRGSQAWHISPTGHRGNDIDLLGFGVDRSINGDGSVNLEKGSGLPGTVSGNMPAPPSQLPENVRGTNSLGTFQVR